MNHMSEETRKGLLVTVVILIIASIGYLQFGKVTLVHGDAVRTEVAGTEDKTKDLRYYKAIEIASPSGFLNTGGAPITIGELVGKKVIMVDFWTYSCINCQRTLPYLNAWYEKYKEQGLEIVSIHTPEFGFEKDPRNVSKAAEQYGIQYPIVQDNDYGTWRAYNNRYWPHKFLIDIDGYIVYDHIGEGGYEETELKIQELLKERSARIGGSTEVGSGVVAPKSAVMISDVGSPETYLGSARNERFGNGTPGRAYASTFSLPSAIDRNTYYLEGAWRLTDEFAEGEGKGKIVYRYKAKNVYLVMSPSASSSVQATVLIDGKPTGISAGKDLHEGKVLIDTDALYHLISHPGGAEEHVIEIVFDDPGVRAFAFTFG